MVTVPLTIKIKDYTYTKNLTLSEYAIPDVSPTQPFIPYTPPTPEICKLGDVKKLSCPDTNEEIIIARCEKNPITGRNQWVETKEVCPPPPKITRIVKILSENDRLPDATEGQTVKIAATVICKSNETETKPRDIAYLIINGAIHDQKSTSGGLVEFEWIATAFPLSTSKVCIRVAPSESCKAPGQDCKTIIVKTEKISPSEQIAIERESAAEQRRLIEKARKGLRSSIIEEPLPLLPSPDITPIYPPIYPSPDITPIDITPITPKPDIEPDTTPIKLEYGSIKIEGISIPTAPITSIYIYVDDQLAGRISKLPALLYNIKTGYRKVSIKAGKYVSPVMTVLVTKDDTALVKI